MAKITIDAHEHVYNGTRTPAYARFFYDSAFTNSDGQSIGAGDQNGNYAAEVAVTYSSGIATIAPFTATTRLDSTIIAGSGRVVSRGSLAIYDANSRYIETVYDNIKIPESPTSTTWAALELVSESITIPYRAEYYNREQIDRLLTNLSAAPLATAVLSGRARLSVAAASPSDPIVVGDNDPRIGKNYIDITAAPYSALANGSDCSAAIQAAISAAAASTTTKTIYSPGGDFVFGSPINLEGTEGITIIGAGARVEPTDDMPATRWIYSGTASAFVKAGATKGLTIKDIAILSNNASFTGDLIDLQPSSGSVITYSTKITDCVIGGSTSAARFARSGIHTAGAVEVFIEKCNFAWAKYGILGVVSGDAYPFATVVHINGCRFVKLINCGIGNPGQQWVVERNTFEFLYGGVATGVAGAIVSNILGGGAVSNGIVIKGNGFWDTNNEGGVWIDLSGNGFVIDGNLFRVGSAATAIKLRGGRGSSVTGNYVFGSSGGQFLDPQTSPYTEFFDDGTNVLESGITKVVTPTFLVPPDLSAKTLTVSHVVAGGSVASGDTTSCTSAGTGAIIGGTYRDAGGFVSLTTGSTPATSNKVFNVNFAFAYSTAPIAVILAPANAAAAALSGNASVYVLYTDISTTKFSARVGSSALTAATLYQWFYQVVGI